MSQISKHNNCANLTPDENTKIRDLIAKESKNYVSLYN